MRGPQPPGSGNILRSGVVHPVVYRYEQTNWPRRVMRLSGAVRPISWLYARMLHHIDRVVYRVSRGRATFTSWVTGLPIVMLTTTGAKSGRPRTLPVLGVPDEGSLVVIASNYGQRRNPAWYHNLRAHPQATIIFEGERREVVARELSGEERERWYARGVDIYPGWTEYRKRAAHRRIPVIELRPTPYSGH
jgi:deazaflavin-dependent oxidoreductase (nitroreductase family)